jgi:flagellar basal-body rod protein FlgG
MDNEGKTAYTRDGAFQISTDGYLMTSAGHLVQGINTNTGNLEAIFVGDNSISVDTGNNILINDVMSYRFNIVTPNNTDTFRLQADNLYYGGDGVSAVNNADYMIRQSALESSNVDIATELTNMMTTLRAFEANQTVLSAIDSTMDLISNDLGKI